jgi:hypothetical protein
MGRGQKGGPWGNKDRVLRISPLGDGAGYAFDAFSDATPIPLCRKKLYVAPAHARAFRDS